MDSFDRLASPCGNIMRTRQLNVQGEPPDSYKKAARVATEMQRQVKFDIAKLKAAFKGR
jgi:hypothetical protein